MYINSIYFKSGDKRFVRFASKQIEKEN